jgi:hypothetical protein
LGPRESRWRNAVLARPVALFALILATHFADASPGGTDINGFVSIADGESFTVVRGDELRRGTRGVTLVAGDIVETGPDAFLVVELQGGSLIGIGPSSGVYFLSRAGGATLVALKGWLKADIRADTKSGAITVLGPRLGIQSQHAVVLLHADERLDAIFDEQGSGTLLLRDTAATHIDKETRPNQFFVRESRGDIVLQPHPSADFLAGMPIAFRDRLPEKASTRAKSPLEPQRVRKVTYLDIQPWLSLPRDWRAGFVTRFRGRLKDPAFFAALDAHLALYPEWVPILHPKQSSEPR